MLLFSAWQQGEAQKKIDTPKKSLVDKNFLNSTVNYQVLIIESTKYDKFQEILTNIIFFLFEFDAQSFPNSQIVLHSHSNSISGSILGQADFSMLCLGHSPSSNLLISSNCLD